MTFKLIFRRLPIQEFRGLILLFLFLTSCKFDSKPDNYAILSGTIESNLIMKREVELFFSGDPKGKLGKYITINEDGTFRDTITNVQEGSYILMTDSYGVTVFLRKGYDLVLDIDYEISTGPPKVTYGNIGIAPNNKYLELHSFFSNLADDYEYYQVDSLTFNRQIQKTVGQAKKILYADKDELDVNFLTFGEQYIDGFRNTMTDYYNKLQETLLLNGEYSPKFVGFENYNGGTTSMNSLLGQYIYINFWATWCFPCVAEMPALKKLEKDYESKNISFVNIAVDDKENYEDWRLTVQQKELTGTQLFANDRKFINALKVKRIPRYIILDPEGRILNAQAPKPSNDYLRTILDNLKI